MSSSMHWRPASPKQFPPRLSAEFQQLVHFRLFGNDRDWTDSAGPLTVDAELIPYLEGIRDASTRHSVRSSATDLIEAIREHSLVEVWIQR